MSDLKTMNLTSLVTKKTRRAKARLLQNFGKADKTTDEIFEVYLSNFNRQQSTALNLQKHVKHYAHCLKELHEASKGLSQCLMEMHERDWPKHDTFENNAYEMDHINEDLEEKLKESVLVPLEQYLVQFTELREKIAKRGRKLVDYDSQRHTFEALQQHHMGKQQDDSKLSKSRDQLEEAKRVYDSLNNELHEELPAVFDNRLPFIITVFQRLFSSKITYHADNLAIQKSYFETVEQLAKATEKGSLSSAIPQSLINNKPMVDSVQQSKAQTKHQSQQQVTSANQDSKQQHQAVKTNSNYYSEQPNTQQSQSNPNGTSSDNKEIEELKAEMRAEMAENESRKPSVILYKVKATYKYLAEDEDELSFEAGDIIQVIEYDDPLDQEEGWLMGIKESTGQKGLFPANFTKEI